MPTCNFCGCKVSKDDIEDLSLSTDDKGAVYICNKNDCFIQLETLRDEMADE